jgi:hypothetical protein
VAQTKRKRKSKHRGTAAGTVQARGRTSRPPSEKARKELRREAARDLRLARPPTWSRAFKTAGFAGVAMFVFLFLIVGKGHKDPVGAAIGLSVLATAFYVPAGYYMERFMWRRRMEKKAQGR